MDIGMGNDDQPPIFTPGPTRVRRGKPVDARVSDGDAVPPEQRMLVSVIIATRNRSQHLSQALRSFEHIVVPPGHCWELIVVDNNSNDDTAEVVRTIARDSSLPLNYIFEQRRGKSVALNTALQQAKGDIIAFTDDDCIVDRSWIETIVNEFAQDPSLSGVGGRVELYDVTDMPVCIRTYKNRELFSPSRFLALIFGCNMAFGRTVFQEIGGFDPGLGPGTKCESGDDLDLLYRAHKKGMKILYVPDILVYHNHGRKTQTDVRASFRGYGIAKGALYCKHVLQRDSDMLRIAYWEARSILKRSIQAGFINGARRPNEIRLLDLLTGAAIHASQRISMRVPRM